jgi:hypothetical protein
LILKPDEVPTMIANRFEFSTLASASTAPMEKWRRAKPGVILPVILATALGGLIAAGPASADEHHRGPEWHDRDIHHFHEHDVDIWRHGRWFHGDHLGRPGWWWIVGGAWYFYPAPVYPYPDPYVPPGVVAAPSPASYYYYCPRPRGYYPYVAACRVPWRAVAAPPPGAAMPPPP